MGYRVGILTVSDLGARGLRPDTSGQAIREIISSLDAQIVRYEVVPDERDQIEDRLRRWADDDGLDLVLTTGGTGLGPRDVTPEATRAVIDREAPGLVMAMVCEGLKHTPLAMLTRAVAGLRGRTLIVNLPGSPKAVRENLQVILPVLPHALELARGEPSPHQAS
ncbi:MAG TPA: MogA/MoaB family molybdenum cofactor biosynthesis protein [Dehalococcoidia bacterium]|nr:MogA/MoaB family molybdenum cofactor biosynthesis protein [Dehalococcoidia bacterium]